MYLSGIAVEIAAQFQVRMHGYTHKTKGKKLQCQCCSSCRLGGTGRNISTPYWDISVCRRIITVQNTVGRVAPVSHAPIPIVSLAPMHLRRVLAV